MTSILLRAACRYVVPLQLGLSVFFLLRGHNLPGGGFIGGLLAASALALISMSFGVDRAHRMLWVRPEFLSGLGLLIAAGSSLFAPLGKQGFMKGLWGPSIFLPGLGKIALGTPFLFDVGVYLVVLGVTARVVFTLLKDEKEEVT